jgi:two-component system, sensor histidine kinase and response regulator
VLFRSSLFELRARVRSMLRIKQQYDDLLAAVRLREEMANMIVHDMRSPLTAILGYVEFLCRNLPGDAGMNPQHEGLDAIAAQTRRLNALAMDLLLLAKMQSGKLVVHHSEVDVAEVVYAVQSTHALAAKLRQVDLVLDLPAEDRMLLLDRSLLERLLDNLLSNALKFAPTGSSVTVRVLYGPDPSGLCLQVIDEGPGVPLEHRARIFDQFEIIAMRHEGLEQIGLGLAFCKMVVDAYGGRIAVADNSPKGSIFTVELSAGVADT